MGYSYTNYCCAGHTVTIRGLFAKWRHERWWKRHDKCPCVDYKTVTTDDGF